MYLFGSVDPSREHEGKLLWILIRPILANSRHNHIEHDFVSFRCEVQSYFPVSVCAQSYKAQREQTIRQQPRQILIVRQIPRPQQRLTFFPPGGIYERRPEISHRNI